MMNVIALSQVLPYPLDAGPKVRAYYVLRYLAQQHRITLLAFTRTSDSAGAVAHLETFCEAVHTVPVRRSRFRDVAAFAASAATGRPFVIQRDYRPAMARKLDELLALCAFDTLHADQLWMAQYALRAKAKVRDGRPMLVLDEHNACYRIFERLARGERHPLKRLLLEREWRALARYEAHACAQFDHVITVMDEDRQMLRARPESIADAAGGPKWKTIPICVDPDEQPVVGRADDARDVLHLGTMFFLPNVEGVLWFARKVWPRVRAKVPEATFIVAGRRPPRTVQRLGEDDDSIQITGYVCNPVPYLRQAAVFIVPLHSGSGMRVKILDAWCWGIPIVSTTIGAEGIDCRDGETILIADEPEAFANAVVRVLRDAQLGQTLAENGRRRVEQEYNWRTTYTAWDEVYAPLSAGGAR